MLKCKMADTQPLFAFSISVLFALVDSIFIKNKRQAMVVAECGNTSFILYMRSARVFSKTTISLQDESVKSSVYSPLYEPTAESSLACIRLFATITKFSVELHSESTLSPRGGNYTMSHIKILLCHLFIF